MVQHCLHQAHPWLSDSTVGHWEQFLPSGWRWPPSPPRTPQWVEVATLTTPDTPVGGRWPPSPPRTGEPVMSADVILIVMSRVSSLVLPHLIPILFISVQDIISRYRMESCLPSASFRNSRRLLLRSLEQSGDPSRPKYGFEILFDILQNPSGNLEDKYSW